MATSRQKSEDEKWDRENAKRPSMRTCPECERKVDLVPHEYVFLKEGQARLYFCSEECKQAYLGKLEEVPEDEMEKDIGDMLEEGFAMLEDDEDDDWK